MDADEMSAGAEPARLALRRGNALLREDRLGRHGNTTVAVLDYKLEYPLLRLPFRSALGVESIALPFYKADPHFQAVPLPLDQQHRLHPSGVPVSFFTLHFAFEASRELSRWWSWRGAGFGEGRRVGGEGSGGVDEGRLNEYGVAEVKAVTDGGRMSGAVGFYRVSKRCERCVRGEPT